MNKLIKKKDVKYKVKIKMNREQQIENVLFSDLRKEKNENIRIKSGKIVKVTINENYYIVTSSKDDEKYFAHVYKMIDQGGKSVIKEWKEDETIFDLINESVMEIEEIKKA